MQDEKDETQHGDLLKKVIAGAVVVGAGAVVAAKVINNVTDGSAEKSIEKGADKLEEKVKDAGTKLNDAKKQVADKMAAEIEEVRTEIE